MLGAGATPYDDITPSKYRDKLLQNENVDHELVQEFFALFHEIPLEAQAKSHIQQDFWSSVADSRLDEQRHLHLTADLLRKLLIADPDREYYGNESYAVKLIKDSPQFKAAVSEFIKEYGRRKGVFAHKERKGFSDTYKYRDLLAALHKGDIAVHGKKHPDGMWIFQCTIGNVVDFSLFQTNPEKLKQGITWYGSKSASLAEKHETIRQVSRTIDFIYKTI